MAQLLLSLAQLLVAIILGAVTAYLSFYLFQLFTPNLDEWEELRRANTAVGLVLGAIVVSVALIVRPALVVDTAAWDAGSRIYGQVLLAEGLQLAIGLVLAVLALALALVIFAFLTRGIDEITELKKGNLAIGGLLAGVVLGVALMVSQAVGEIAAAVVSLVF